MVMSINTNAGALFALQTLNKTNMQLSTTQSRINTGLKVASAKDNGAVYAIAQNLRSDVAGLSAAKDSLDRATSTLDVALAAGEAIGDLLLEMKDKVTAAADASLDAVSRAALQADYQQLEEQIEQIYGELNPKEENYVLVSEDKGYIFTLILLHSSFFIMVSSSRISPTWMVGTLMSGTSMSMSGTCGTGIVQHAIWLPSSKSPASISVICFICLLFVSCGEMWFVM